MAPESLPLGSDFPSQIVKAIGEAKVLVLVLSRYSNESRAVQQEVRLAFEKERGIVPIQIEPVDLSDELKFYIATAHRLESTQQTPAADLDRLVSAVQSTVKEAELSRAARLSRLIRRYRYPLAAACVLLLLAACYPAMMTWLHRWTNPIDGQRYAWIPPGEFLLGCSPGDSSCDDDEKPASRQTVANGFWLATTEVTVKQWNAYATKHGLKPLDEEGHGDLPVMGVTRDEAIAYCRAVGARLPTEREWEYAARAGSQASRYGRLPEIAWFKGNSDEDLHPGGEKLPNAFGLYDTLGNVWEWASDRYFDRYDEEGEEEPLPSTDGVPDIPPNGSGVVRGGSSLSEASALRASNRFGIPTDLSGVVDPLIGIRCARNHR